MDNINDDYMAFVREQEEKDQRERDAKAYAECVDMFYFDTKLEMVHEQFNIR